MLLGLELLISILPVLPPVDAARNRIRVSQQQGARRNLA